MWSGASFSNTGQWEGIMLGEQIGVFEGKITAQRVLPSDAGPKLETTAEASGKILGVAARVIATYWTVMLRMVRSTERLLARVPPSRKMETWGRIGLQVLV